MRLGEYDVSTTADGKHKDIDIVHAVKHERYIKNAGIDDIAMVYLKKHVEFNGNLENDFSIGAKIRCQFWCFVLFPSDRISPICLPDTRDLLDRSFVGMNPFIGNTT